MIKIIDEGPHHSVVKNAICKNCGVTLSYVPADVKERKGHNARDGSWGYQWINCPKCNEEITTKSW